MKTSIDYVQNDIVAVRNLLSLAYSRLDLTILVIDNEAGRSADPQELQRLSIQCDAARSHCKEAIAAAEQINAAFLGNRKPTTEPAYA